MQLIVGFGDVLKKLNFSLFSVDFLTAAETNLLFFFFFRYMDDLSISNQLSLKGVRRNSDLYSTCIREHANFQYNLRQ